MPERVLLLSYAFPPMALPEAFLSAKRMGNLPGATVDVLCAEPFRAWQGHDPTLLTYVSDRFSSVERVTLPSPVRGLPLGRLGPLVNAPDLFRWLNRSMRRALNKRDVSVYDAVVTWSQFHSVHLIGPWLKPRLRPGTPWLAHFSDPWTGNPYVSWSPRLAAYNTQLERRVQAAADVLLYTTPETVQLVRSQWDEPPATAMEVVPHGFDPALYPPTQPATSGRLLIRHLGAFYGHRTPEPLFAALGLLVSQDPELARRVHVELVGHVPQAHLNTEAFRRLPPGLVSVVQPVDYVSSLGAMREADILLVIDAPSAATSVFLPSKLVDYIGARRPIVAVTPSGASERVTREVGGWVADPNDVTAVAAALHTAVDYAEAHRGEAFGRDVVADRYSTATTSARLAEIIEVGRARK